jgi:hypothetical protein
MGYFSNGTEGMMYEGKYCNRCVHLHSEHSCPCLESHAIWNYDECNKKDSILHKMIPMSGDGLNNEQCIFFVEGGQNEPLHQTPIEEEL